MYKIFRTHRFDRELVKKFSPQEQREVEKFEKNQLVQSPYVGDQLRYPFFREKKVSGKWVYYLIYDDLQAVLMIAVGDKKTQQETIDEIKSKLKEYYAIIKETIKQHDEFDHV